MSSNPFPRKLLYENIDGQKIRLTREFDYHVGHKGSGEIIRVPRGFVCDGMSYPVRFTIAALVILGMIAGAKQNFLWLSIVAISLSAILLGVDITPQGKGVKAGVIHDYLYWLNGQPVPETGISYNREASDKIFREALKKSGVNPVSRFVRYWSLRIAGWKAWNDHAKRIATGTSSPGIIAANRKHNS